MVSGVAASLNVCKRRAPQNKLGREVVGPKCYPFVFFRVVTQKHKAHALIYTTFSSAHYNNLIY